MITLQLLIFLLLSWLTGIALTFISRLPWQLEGRLAAGVPLGFATAAFVTWILAVPRGMSGAPITAAMIGLFAIIVACATQTDWRARLQAELESAGRRWRSPEPIPLVILVVLAGLFFFPFYTHALKIETDGLFAGYVNIWGDWATHLSMSGYLSNATHVLPPQLPFFAGTRLTYSFMPDFFSGELTHLGPSLIQALPLSSAILSLALVVIFYSVALRLTGSRWAACVATLVLFIGGGLGFLRIFGEINPTGAGLGGWLGGLWHLVQAPPHEYTLDRDLNYQWLNPILAYLIPQRATLFGWSLGLLVLSVLWYGWNSDSQREMLIAGVLLGMTPLLHLSTYIDLLLFAGGLAALTVAIAWRRDGQRRAKRAALIWLTFFVPAGALGIPQMLMILPPAAYGHSFLVWQPGWLAGTGGHHDSAVGFWILNTAALIPLALLTLLVGRWGKPGLRVFLLPAWVLFIIPNFVVLQPWDWDNTKWFMWWAIPISVLVGLAIERLARMGPVLAVVAALLLVTQVASGALDLDRAWQEKLNLPGLRLLDNDELALATWARHTPLDTVFLTGFQHNHPILTMSERVTVMGYPGWLWSWGINYFARQQDVITIFHGDPQATALLAHYHVNYVVIGPDELREAQANTRFFANRYPAVYKSPTGEYTIYRVG